ncbi:MAG: hypothetical protein WCL32_06960 [Planctomycetota bacterium]
MLQTLTSLWQPAHFFLANGLRCAWQFEAEQTLPWELFRGRLLGPGQARATQTFLSWNLLPVEGGVVGSEPLLSLLLDDAGSVFVTRSLLCRVWTPVDSSEGIGSEQRDRWVRELIGVAHRPDFASESDWAAEAASLIAQAIVGTSRLPLTSTEAPLPQFTFGQLTYVRRHDLTGVDVRVPRRSWQELLATASPADLDEAGQAKLLEILLRSTPAEECATAFAKWLGVERLPAVFRHMFNDVSLSPYTDFVDRALAALSAWAMPAPLEIDILAGLILQIVRHLTAYDLTLFHYRGANYPDALLLDSLLRQLIARAESQPTAFTESSPEGLRRRRALRAGCLLRSRYEGHAVPDQPTSPGENARVTPLTVVPEEQIHEPQRRTRRLYANEPLASLLPACVSPILAQACGDLRDPQELREGGMALFIDRPLGFFKAPAEIDQTPLLSYEAFSRRLAIRRLLDTQALARMLELDVPTTLWEESRTRLLEMNVIGVSLDRIPESPRPAVSLADARKVESDFVVLRTMPRSLRQFWTALDRPALPCPLVVRVLNDAGQPVMAGFDHAGTKIAEFDADWSQGSQVRAGIETPRSGLRDFGS